MGLRYAGASNRYRSNPMSLASSLAITAFLCFTGFQMGMSLAQSAGSVPANVWLSEVASSIMLYVGALALSWWSPGLMRVASEPIPSSALRHVSISGLQKQISEIVAWFIDLPGLVALSFPLPFILISSSFGALYMVCAFLGAAAFLVLVIVSLSLTSLIGNVLPSFMRIRKEARTVPAAMFLFLSIGMPPACAALTHPSIAGLSHPLSTAAISNSTQLEATSPDRLLAIILRLAATGGSVSEGVRATAELAIWSILVCIAALFALRSQKEIQAIGSSWTGGRTPSWLTQRASINNWPFSSGVIGAVTTDLKLLLRETARFTQLRQPGAAVILVMLAFLAPDFGKNTIYVSRELLCLAASAYTLIWQMQLMCNRFGVDGDRLGLLLGLTGKPARLIVVRNISLMLLLLLIDIPAFGLTAVTIERKDIIAPGCIVLAIALCIWTSIGNILSLSTPFAIQRFGRLAAEPPGYLSGCYVVAAVAGIWFAMFILSTPAAVSILPVMWLISVLLGSRLMVTNQQRYFGVMKGDVAQ